MEKKNILANLIDWMNEKNFTSWGKDILYVLLWSGVVFGLTISGNGTVQTDIDRGYYIACIFFAVILMVIKKTNPFFIPTGIVLFSYTGSVIFYLAMMKEDWGPVYRNVLIVKFIYYALLIIIGIDMLRYAKKKIVKLKQIEKPFAICFLVAAALMCIFDFSTGIQFLLPVALLFLTPLRREEWNRLVLHLAIAFYFVFVAVMLYSLIAMKDNFYVDGRFAGIFAYTATAGAFCSLTFLALLYMFFALKDKVKNKIVFYAVMAVMAIFLGVMIINFQDRTTFLGIACIAIAYLLMHAARKGKWNLAYTAAITFLLILAFSELFIFFLGNADYEAMETTIENINNKFISNSLTYFLRKMQSVSSAKKTNGVFAVGTAMNSLDRFFSNRLSIWHVGLRQIKFFGGSDTWVNLPNGMYVGHVHNIFLDWLLRYGIIGGIAAIGWFFYYLAMAAKRKFDGDETVLFSFLLTVFSVGFLFFERELWNTSFGFLLVIFQYPLIIKFKRQEKHENV